MVTIAKALMEGAADASGVNVRVSRLPGAGGGVGVDMVDIRELADMIETSGQSFMDMSWTPAEQAYCAGSIPRLAARWAAKEATMKALGHGIGEVDPIDIEVVSAEGERPSMQLHGSAAALARALRVGHLAVSLSHEANFAVAFVVATSDGFDTEARVPARPGSGGRKGSRGSAESRDHVGSRLLNEKDGRTDGG